MKLSIFKDKRTSYPDILITVYKFTGSSLNDYRMTSNEKINISLSVTRKITRFWSRYCMQACSQGNLVSNHWFSDNCLKGNMRSILSCFDALSYLCAYFFELLELSRAILFSFCPYAFYSFRGSIQYVPYLFRLAINKGLSQPFSYNKGIRISETINDRSNPTLTCLLQIFLHSGI